MRLDCLPQVSLCCNRESLLQSRLPSYGQNFFGFWTLLYAIFSTLSVPQVWYTHFQTKSFSIWSVDSFSISAKLISKYYVIWFENGCTLLTGILCSRLGRLIGQMKSVKSTRESFEIFRYAVGKKEHLKEEKSVLICKFREREREAIPNVPKNKSLKLKSTEPLNSTARMIVSGIKSRTCTLNECVILLQTLNRRLWTRSSVHKTDLHWKRVSSKCQTNVKFSPPIAQRYHSRVLLGGFEANKWQLTLRTF